MGSRPRASTGPSGGKLRVGPGCMCSLRTDAGSQDRKTSAGSRNRRRTTSHVPRIGWFSVSPSSTQARRYGKTSMPQRERHSLSGNPRSDRDRSAGQASRASTAPHRKGNLPQSYLGPSSSLHCSGGSGGFSVLAFSKRMESPPTIFPKSNSPSSAVAPEGLPVTPFLLV